MNDKILNAEKEKSLGHYGVSYHLYCESIEMCLKMMRTEKSKELKEDLKGTISRLLQDAEEMKKKSKDVSSVLLLNAKVQETNGSKFAGLESWEQSYESYVIAIENYVKFLKTSTNKSKILEVKSTLNTLLSNAEFVKKRKKEMKAKLTKTYVELTKHLKTTLLNIPFEEIINREKILDLNCSTLFKANWTKSGGGIEILCKEFTLKDGSFIDPQKLNFLSHPFHLNVIGYAFKKSKFVIIYEYLNVIQLSEYCVKNKLSYYEKFVIIKKMIQMLHFISSKKLVHSELNSDSFMISRNKKILKMHDFGIKPIKLASEVVKETFSFTDRFLAPECCLEESPEYSKKSDVFSLGMIIYHLVCEEEPGEEMSLEMKYKDEVPKLPKDLPDFFSDLINLCWTITPSKRPSSTDLLQKVISEEEAFLKKYSNQFTDNLLIQFEGPITNHIMEDPVILVSTGCTYEREAIVEWLKENNTDPLTNQQLTTKNIVPNIALRNAIFEWKKLKQIEDQE